MSPRFTRCGLRAVASTERGCIWPPFTHEEIA
jgi:hypothetical protein